MGSLSWCGASTVIKPRYVYMFATYGEHGLEGRVATLDRASVPALLDSFLGTGFTEEDRTHAKEILRDVLRHPDENCKHDLMFGWGGVQLYVIELA